MSADPASGTVSLPQRRLFLPFTALFLFIMVIANLAAGSIPGTLPRSMLEAWGIAHYRLIDGEVWRLLTGTFLSHDSGMFLRQFVFAALVIGLYETRRGPWRTAAMFFVIDILGTALLFLLVIAPLSGLPHPVFADLAMRHDVGMSAGGFGLIGALLAPQRRRWLWFGAVFAALAVKIAVQPDIIPDTAHILTLTLGFALERALPPRIDHRKTAP